MFIMQSQAVLISSVTFNIRCDSKKNNPVYFTVSSTYVEQFLQYLARVHLTKYATQNWCRDEDAELQLDRVIADARSDHHWQPRSQSSTRATYAFSTLWLLSAVSH